MKQTYLQFPNLELWTLSTTRGPPRAHQRLVDVLDALACVAGTPLTLAAIAWESTVDAVGGRTLSLETVEATVARLLDLPLVERRALPGMLPQRADVLPGGGLLLAAAYARLGVREALLERNDLLLGHLLATH